MHACNLSFIQLMSSPRVRYIQPWVLGPVLAVSMSAMRMSEWLHSVDAVEQHG